MKETTEEAFTKLRKALTELGDGIMINLEELRLLLWDRQFWIGTITFMVLAGVIAIDGCMRRGV